jgi:hypothetical protein
MYIHLYTYVYSNTAQNKLLGSYMDLFNKQGDSEVLQVQILDMALVRDSSVY